MKFLTEYLTFNTKKKRDYINITPQVEDVVEHGIGGQVVSNIVEGERRHELVVRYGAEHRSD